MTKHARSVLADCEAALVELQRGVSGVAPPEVFITITLLRSVGHVLDKVDGLTPEVAQPLVDRRIGPFALHGQ